MLNCTYDLNFNPPTYDVVTFLVTRERERLRKEEDSIAIDIRPGPIEGFRRDNCWPLDSASRRDLLNNIVIPMCGMLPSCRRVTVLHNDSRDVVKGSGFGEYSIPFKHFVTCIKDGIRPLRPRDEVAKTKGLITITLRECEHWPKRNSNEMEWRRAADDLSEMGYKVAIVRDTRKAEERFWNHPVRADAALRLTDRAALYCSAECNLFVNNGPAWFCMALDAPMIMLKPATEGIGRIYSAEGRRQIGMIPGQQMVGAPSHQRLVWEDDNHANIMRAVQRFMEEKKDERDGHDASASSRRSGQRASAEFS